MFATLGTIEFDLLTSFSALESRHQSHYVEHGSIGHKPVLQALGSQLDEWKIEIRLHTSYCQPCQKIEQLRDAQREYQVLPLVLGNGRYLGRFVLTCLHVDHQENNADGELLLAMVTLTLRECAGDVIHVSPGEAVCRPIPGQCDDKPTPPPPPTCTRPSAEQACLIRTRDVCAAAHLALCMASAVIELFRCDPRAAQERAPEAICRLAKLIPMLGRSLDCLRALRQRGGEIAAKTDVLIAQLRTLQQLLRELICALGHLGGSTGDATTQLARAEQALLAAQQALAQAEQALNWLIGHLSIRTA